MSDKRLKKLVLLHSNDMHGDFLAENVDKKLVGGVSMLSGYVEKVRREEEYEDGSMDQIIRDGLFYIDVNRYIDGKDNQYDDTKERMELEKIADKLFG